MQRYRTIKACNGYTLQRLYKILCFNIWMSIFTGNMELVNSYINNIKGGAIILTNF